MDFEEIRKHFWKLMPENLCGTSVRFFGSVEEKCALITHLKKYSHWSIKQGLITWENVELLGVDFCDQHGIYVGLATDLHYVEASDVFLFNCEIGSLVINSENSFVYLRDCKINTLEIRGDCTQFVFLHGNQVEHVIVSSVLTTMRVYESNLNRLDVTNKGLLKRLVNGKGAQVMFGPNQENIQKIINF